MVLMLLAAGLALSMTATPVMGIFSTVTPVFAESITVNQTDDSHTYEAYQIFKGTVSNGQLTEIDWGDNVVGTTILQKLKEDSTVGAKFTNCNSAASVAAVMAEMNDNDADMRAIAKVFGANLTGAAKASATSENQYKLDNLDSGYYLVKDQDDSITTPDTVTEDDEAYTRFILKLAGTDVTVTPKASKPTLEKEIQNNDDDEWGVVGDNQIGDTVNFRTITTVPDTTDYTTYTYKITDTMSSGLTSNVKGAGDVEIKVDDEGEPLSTDYYSVSANGNTFEISVNILKLVEDELAASGQELYSYYNGTVNTGALIYDTGKQDNKAQLEFSNNPNSTGTGKTVEKTVYDWTFKINVNKTDATTDAALLGAKFVLSEDGALADSLIDTSGALTSNADTLAKLIKLTSTTDYTVNSAGSNYVIEPAGANAQATIKGLDDQTTYYLYEIEAPKGYNRITAPTPFTIKATYSTDGSNYTSVTIGEEGSTDTIDLTIENNSGSTLPSTGGMGTTMLYIAGGVLVLGSVVFFMTNRKMRKD